MIPITDADLSSLPLPTAKTIEIVAFVPADSIDPLQMDAAYYLSANGVPAAKPYTLLREALKRSRKVAIAKFALRGRERLGMLRVVDDVIAMHGLLWPDEIRASEGVAPETGVSVRDAELDLADALMDTLGEVDMSTLHDDYRTAVEELIAAKADGALPAREEAPAPGSGKVIDLMAALENSVKAAKASRGEGEEGGGESVAEVTHLGSRRSAPAKKTARKTATKTAAKKSAPAKKTARRRARRRRARRRRARRRRARRPRSPPRRARSPPARRSPRPPPRRRRRRRSPSPRRSAPAPDR